MKLNPVDRSSFKKLEEGQLLLATGKVSEAVAWCHRVLRDTPGNADVWALLGKALVATRGDGLFVAISCYQKALALKPEQFDWHLRLADCYDSNGLANQAIQCYEAVVEKAPDNLEIQARVLIGQLSQIYRDQSHVDERYAAYCAQLEHLEGFVNNHVAVLPRQRHVVRYLLNFQLPYQLRDHREIQARLGALICRIQAACYPQWSKPLMKRKLSGRRPRIGIVCGFFNRHSIWKIQIKGWLEQLDQTKFELYGYSTEVKEDSATEIARSRFSYFVSGCLDFETLAGKIADDALDILLYPEIGMNRLTLELAALRLAPVQCVSWGHPITSGLPTMDYMLSADLLEPEGAELQYTEQLVRLPNLSSCYEPIDIAPSPTTRSDFGLEADGVVFLCVQTVHKYLTKYDSIYASIAKRCPKARFVFLQRGFSSKLFDQFYQRLVFSFEEASLEPTRYLHCLPQLSTDHYQALNSVADVCLDSIGWSGHTTTLEAVSNDLPVVTFPGDFMRTRLSTAVFEMIGVRDTIVDSVDAYIDVAVRLGNDVTYREQVQDQISQNKSRLYGDVTPVRALEAFFMSKCSFV